MTTALALAAAVAALRWRRIAALLPRRRPAPPDPSSVAGLLSVGLHAGLSLPAAIEAAADAIGVPGSAPLDRVLRDARVAGLGHALATSTGPLADLLRRVAESERSGAPVLATLAAYERERDAAARSEHIERARSLPVRLAIPLTLLVLPGSVLALLGPTVVDLLGRTIGSLAR